MKLPGIHDIRFLADEFFLRALRKWGLADQMAKSSLASARFQTTATEILLGDRSKAKETELIERIAELEIYLSALVNALGAQSDVKTAIHAKLDKLRDEALTK